MFLLPAMYEERKSIPHLPPQNGILPNRNSQNWNPKGVFQRYWRNRMWKFQALIKRKLLGIFIGDQEKIVWNFIGSGISLGLCNTIFQNFQGWRFILCEIPRVRKQILKFQSFFPNPWCVFARGLGGSWNFTTF